MAWSEDSDNCISVYTTLVDLEKNDQSVHFADAGPLKMQDLQFLNTTKTPALQLNDATRLAKTLNNIFIRTFQAPYRSGYDADKAVAAMITCPDLRRKDRDQPVRYHRLSL